MTAIKAKEISLEVWRYLVRHPEIDNKRELPLILLDKIRHEKALCPLCTLFAKGSARCPGCPLRYCYDGSAFSVWVNSRTKRKRRAAALKIVRRLEAWEPGEEA